MNKLFLTSSLIFSFFLTACDSASFCLNASNKDDEFCSAELISQELGLPDNVKLVKKPHERLPDGVDIGIFLSNTVFEFNSYTLTEDMAEVLLRLGPYLDQQEFSRIIFHGHTDSIGSDEYNQTLSEERALSVSNFLLDEGWLQNVEMETEGFGESQPIESNDTDEGRAQNRRVEIFLIY